jgi:hypothetical protein
MKELEQSKDESGLWIPGSSNNVRGGWLCDEVGMGKSAVLVVIALHSLPPMQSSLSQRVVGHGAASDVNAGRPKGWMITIHTPNTLVVVVVPKRWKKNRHFHFCLIGVQLVGQWNGWTNSKNMSAPTIKVERYHIYTIATNLTF